MGFEKGKVPEGSNPFKKGESGNPNGRPRKLPNLDVLLADVLGEEKDGVTAAQAILMKLRQTAAGGNTQTAIRAAEILLDRGYGKPKQHIAHSGAIAQLPAEIDYSKLSDGALDEIAAAASVRPEAGAGGTDQAS